MEKLIPKGLSGWRSVNSKLHTSLNFGNRGKGNEIQSFIENAIDFFSDITGKLKEDIKKRGLITGTAPLPTFKSVSRFINPASPVRSTPLFDIFRLQLPTFKTKKLGYGHYYRSVGNDINKIKNAIVPPKNSVYNKYDLVYWSKNEPLREYTKNSALLVRYNANGPYKFGVGNFKNPTSSVSNPIEFNDPNITLFGRFPFTSWYKEIPKTEEGFKLANTLGKLNKYVETPIRRGVKLYLGKKAYDYTFSNNDNNEK